MQNFQIDKFYEELSEIASTIKKLQKQKKQIESQIEENYREKFQELFSQKNKPYGTVSITHGEFDIKVTRPKKVTYDQEKLSNLYAEIKKHEDPSLYITVKYDVSETSYKKFSKEIKSVFDKIRTIDYGTTKIEIIKND